MAKHKFSAGPAFNKIANGNYSADKIMSLINYFQLQNGAD